MPDIRITQLRIAWEAIVCAKNFNGSISFFNLIYGLSKFMKVLYMKELSVHGQHGSEKNK